MEETIGYEVLFSPEEWDSLDLYTAEEEEVGFPDVDPDWTLPVFFTAAVSRRAPPTY